MYKYNDYSNYLKRKYGGKVYKLPVNLPVTCPNRDGRKGTCGCTFCGEAGAAFESLDSAKDIKEQLEENRMYMGGRYKAKKFIAYLQNYTNTYLPVSDFRTVLEKCVADDIVAISVSTRPDCINEKYLEIADSVKQKYGTDIVFELGLQSVNTHTLRLINRGHTLAEFVNSVLKIKNHGFCAGVHLIPNLPYDDENDVIEAAQLLSVLKVDTVKLHNLFLMQGTKMADDYLNGAFSMGGYEEYFDKVALFLRYLSPDTAIERFFARCPEPGCVFSNWGRSWRYLQNELMKYLDENNVIQGSEMSYSDGIIYGE